MHARRLLLVVTHLGFVVAMLVGGPARAEPSLAVLPLTQAAGSSSYDGLGDALAGMIVSDLAAVPGIRLVERARLDALLAEIELGDSGFVDAKTAQRLGRGAGAELVLVGTYSVIDARFLLDGRIVRVESGDIVKATAAQGTVDDFVTVEKDLVEGLLDGLDVAISSSLRRKLLMQAPTETFDALSAYGEGVARERAGRLEEARAAYDRALAADPAFVDARRSLDRLTAAVERSRARAADALSSERGTVLAALISASPAPRRNAPGDDPDAIAALLLRWMALTDQRDDCTVADELITWTRARRWALPDRRAQSAILHAVQTRAQAVGYVAVPRDIAAPQPAYDHPAARAQAFLDPTRLLALDRYWSDAPKRDGLVGAITRCHRGPARPEALDAVFAALPAGAIPSKGALSTRQAAEITWAHWHANDVGASPELEHRLTALLRAAESSDAARGPVQDAVERISAEAREVGLRRVRRDGASADEILAFAAALQARDPTVIDLDRSTCKQMVQNERPRGAVLLGALQTLEPDSRSWHTNVDQIGQQRHAMALVGCLRGIDATWASADAIRIGLLARLERLRPDARDDPACASVLASLDTQLSDEHMAQVKTWPKGEDSWTWAVLAMYLAMEGSGCVEVPSARTGGR